MSLELPIPRVLMIRGWHGAAPAHWASQWQAAHGYPILDQHDWLRPLRGDWLMQLEEAVLKSKSLASPSPDVCRGASAHTPEIPVAAPDTRHVPALTLVAHGLGCQLVAAWALHSRHTHLVKAALLVAPADVEREALRPVLASWSPIPWGALPFSSILVGGPDDPHCSFERAHAFARAWGSDFVESAPQEFIDSGADPGGWPQGHALLLQLLGPGHERAGPDSSLANHH